MVACLRLTLVDSATWSLLFLLRLLLVLGSSTCWPCWVVLEEAPDRGSRPAPFLPPMGIPVVRLLMLTWCVSRFCSMLFITRLLHHSGAASTNKSVSLISPSRQLPCVRRALHGSDFLVRRGAQGVQALISADRQNRGRACSVPY
jgi:hypothetical protein